MLHVIINDKSSHTHTLSPSIDSLGTLIFLDETLTIAACIQSPELRLLSVMSVWGTVWGQWRRPTLNLQGGSEAFFSELVNGLRISVYTGR